MQASKEHEDRPQQPAAREHHSGYEQQQQRAASQVVCPAPKQPVGHMPAVQLPDRQEIDAGNQNAEPGCEEYGMQEQRLPTRQSYGAAQNKVDEHRRAKTAQRQAASV